MRIFAALISVGVLLFTGVGALLFLISVSAVATLDNEILLVLGVATVVATVVVLIRVGQHYQWTGFGESVHPKLDNQEIQPRKTLWDWLQLFIVPLALAAIGLWFSAQQDARQQRLEEQRAQNAALQAYLDQMSQLMLEGGLLSSGQDSEVRTLARARTQTVLGQLDSDRKASVVQFLYEASLINDEQPVLNLSDIGLRGANLSQLDLSGVNLSGAELTDADLHGTDLSDAILSSAELNSADLRGASMSGTNLSSAELNNADLSGVVDLNNADLNGADLSGANMSGALLEYAKLREAQLIGTDLRGADLSMADLRYARLNRAKGVTEEELKEQAKALKGATMPGGSIHR